MSLSVREPIDFSVNVATLLFANPGAIAARFERVGARETVPDVWFAKALDQTVLVLVQAIPFPD